MDNVILFNKSYITQHYFDTLGTFQATEKFPGPCNIMIRWGNMTGDDLQAKMIVNRKAALRNCMYRASILKILKINKIRRPRLINPIPESTFPLLGKKNAFESGQIKNNLVKSYDEAIHADADFFVQYLPIVKKYKVFVYNYSVIGLYKKIPIRTHSALTTPNWNYEEIPATLDQDATKISNFAKRAIHVLGLDFGLVYAGIDTRGRAIALEINSFPDLPDQILKDFSAAVLSSKKNTLKKDEDVMLGADPEFVLRDRNTGKMVYPSQYLTKEGPIGYDERSERREGRFFPLAEIRPSPEYCPLQLVNNIRFLLQKANKILPSHIEWLSGSTQFEQYHLGGHIHFSNIKLNSLLMRALDNYLGIPLFLIESPNTSVLRRRQYGWIGSVREKAHGGFEYRTPASWLVSPQITKAALCLAKIVVTEYKNLKRDFFLDINKQKSFYQGNQLDFYDVFEKLWLDIMDTTTYDLYAHHLSSIEEMIRNRVSWNEQLDIKPFWGLI